MEKFVISAAKFDHQQEVPKKYTCQGEDVSPAISWANLPKGAKSLVLIVEDPDAPDPKHPKMVWDHWLLYNIPASMTGLSEGAGNKQPEAGMRPGLNSWKNTGYGGPCPPIGKHRYFFKLFALDVMLQDLGKPSKVDLEKAMQDHVLAKAELVGTYQKQ
jgi:Raf kinase inhibitor-like YbhB/YbcL family protein